MNDLRRCAHVADNGMDLTTVTGVNRWKFAYQSFGCHAASWKNEEPGHSEAQENNTMITFGRKLKHLRQKNHLTQKELGMAVGFPDSCADVRIAV